MIEVLSPQVRDQIAAGEVVERPASVVKELIENAIDAGARAISIEARDGGLALIRVADNGSGMSRADASLAIEPFATSKIRSLAELTSIRTLGFRGEALSSIAAVSELELLTRIAGETEGTRLRAAEGSTAIEPAASPVGASVTVRDLFARFPARRRFLKSRMRETELIQQTTVQYALAYPEIAFRLVVDGRERLALPQSSPLARLSAVLGRDVAAEMMAVHWQALDLCVDGFVSRPSIGRSRRDAQFFYVNGRPVRAGLLAVMAERPYAGRLPHGRCPLAVIHIAIDPLHVDVNVHPRKAEVRFSQERSVYGAVSAAVNDALQGYPPQAETQDYAWPFAGWPGGRASQIAEESGPYVSGGARALAQLHNTYILAQVADGLVIVDQHAAHEQVLFEQLSRSSELLELSPPARLDLTVREAEALDRVAALLSEMGIQVEPFGGLSFLVRALPTCLQGQGPVELVEALIAERIPRQADVDEQRQRLAMRAACISAVKAGDALSVAQMQSLLDELLRAWSPATCPHGRPALVSISMEELARRFSR